MTKKTNFFTNLSRRADVVGGKQTKIFKVFILTIFVSCVFSNLYSQNKQKEIVEYAKEYHRKMLELIPLGKEKLYGFENRDMFYNCEIGNPIKMLRISNEREIEATNEWRVPIINNGKYITLLTIIENGKKYEIVDLGGNILAEIIGNYNNQNEKISFWLRDYRRIIDYISFEYKSFSDKNFYEIESKSENNFKNSNGISLNEIIELHNINNK